MAEQYYATQRLTGDGTTTVWPFSFAGGRPDSNSGTSPYLEPEDVQVAKVDFDLDGNETRTPIDFSLQGQDQVRVIPALANGQDFVIYRVTDTDTPVSDFTDFASISERDLDNALRQTLYAVQELSDTSQDTRTFAANAQTRASDALSVANAADDTADNALDVARTARNTANTAISTANAADDTANTADSKADLAINTANTASSDADAANAAVAGAISTADAAEATANAAETAANRADLAAAQAKTTANAAEIAANNADTVAGEAKALATSADATANEAIDTADAADLIARQALNNAGLVTGFQDQLDDLRQQVADLTGVDTDNLTLNKDNLSKLADFAAARTNLSVYSKTETDSAITTATDALSTTLSGLITGVSDDVDTLSTRVTNAESDISTANTAITANEKAITALDNITVPNTRTVSAGNGLTGGGTLGANRTIELGTPGTLSGLSSNGVTSDGHTHSVLSTTSRQSTSTSQLLAAKAMKDHVDSGDHDARYYTKSDVNERVELTNGLIKTPITNICYFQVYKSSNQITTAGRYDKISWSTSLQSSVATPFYNGANSGWNRSKHAFVAPVHGMYEFTAQVVRDSNNTGGGVDIRFGIDGVVQETTSPGGYASARSPTQSVDLGYQTARISMIISLLAGTEITIHCNGKANVYGSSTSRHTWFMGRLL